MTRASIAAAVMSLIVATFGLGALLIGIIYPSRRVFAWTARIWSRAVLFMSGTRLRIEGHQRVSDGIPRFYMANHQSALDIPILVAALQGDVRFMAKKVLFAIPVFGWILSRYGFAPIDRASARVTAATLDRMLIKLRRKPIAFAVFPEGTRTRDGKLLPFRRGTMKIGQRSGLPVVPVTIDGSYRVKHRDEFVCRPGTVRLVFHEPIPADQVAAMSPTELHDHVVGTIARELGQPFEAAHAEIGAYAGAEA